MTTSEMLVELREVLADELPTYGFSTLRALAYLNEGQEKFCEDTGFFTDKTTFSIPTVADQAVYDLDPRIIRVEDVYVGSRQLIKLTGVQPGMDADAPYLWQTDSQTGKLEVWPIPQTAVTMQLHAWRYPLADLKETATIVNPEIPKRMHRACIEWAAFKCYGHHDIELAGGTEALRHKNAYRQYVLEGRALKRNMDAEQIVVGVDCVVNAGCP